MIAWALVSAFAVGVLVGGMLAAVLIVAVRIKVTAADERRRDLTILRRYRAARTFGGER
jgi:hypothetical protein